MIIRIRISFISNFTELFVFSYVCHGLNSHYFHIIGDKLINPIVGVYIPIIRIPIKGGMTIPNIATFDHGTCVFLVGLTYLVDLAWFMRSTSIPMKGDGKNVPGPGSSKPSVCKKNRPKFSPHHKAPKKDQFRQVNFKTISIMGI